MSMIFRFAIDRHTIVSPNVIANRFSYRSCVIGSCLLFSINVCLLNSLPVLVCRIVTLSVNELSVCSLLNLTGAVAALSE